MSFVIKLLPLYLLVAVGFALGRGLGIRGQDIGRMSLFALSPAVVFKGFATANFSGALVWLPLGAWLAAALVAISFAQLANRLWSDGRQRIAAFSAGTGNTGFFGIPACLSLVGPDSLPFAVMISFGVTTYENSVGFYMVARSEATMGGALLRVLKYPGLHACWLGALVNQGILHPPAAILQTADYLAAAFTPVGMMIVGLGLSQVRSFRIDLGFSAFMLGVKFLVWPVLAIGFIWIDRHWLHAFGAVAHKVILIDSLAPMAAITVVHAAMRNIHPDRTAIAVAASTLLALAWLPFVLARFG
jgi:predicted permease